MSQLPALNACMNACCLVCLCLGLAWIKQGRREAHERAMYVATLFGALFLVGYLVYHFGVQSELGPTKFHRQGVWLWLYRAMLLSHVLLAAANVPLVVVTILRARRQDWERHRRLARITWPLWAYVSATGILVYLALYHWNPVPPA